jgi:hypothetical protein
MSRSTWQRLAALKEDLRASSALHSRYLHPDLKRTRSDRGQRGGRRLLRWIGRLGDSHDYDLAIADHIFAIFAAVTFTIYDVQWIQEIPVDYCQYNCSCGGQSNRHSFCGEPTERLVEMASLHHRGRGRGHDRIRGDVHIEIRSLPQCSCTCCVTAGCRDLDRHPGDSRLNCGICGPIGKGSNDATRGIDD